MNKWVMILLILAFSIPAQAVENKTITVLAEDNKPITSAKCVLYLSSKGNTKIPLKLTEAGQLTYPDHEGRFSISIIGQGDFKFYQASFNNNQLKEKESVTIKPGAIIQFNYKKGSISNGARVGAFYESRGQYKSGRSQRISSRDKGKVEFIILKEKKHKVILYKDKNKSIWESDVLDVKAKNIYTVDYPAKETTD